MNDILDTKGEDINITDKARARIAALISEKKITAPNFRVRVDGGGCNGFQYIFDFDEDIKNDDIIFEKDGVKILIDETSLTLLKGSELDYIEDLMGSYFTVRNPNASSSCGCGTSFSI